MRARADRARADSARADRAREDNSNARDDRSSALAESARDDRSRARADNARELSALEERASSVVFSSNAADITASHALFDTLMTDFSPTQVNYAPAENRWRKYTVPKFTLIRKENFTKNLKAKLTTTRNMY